MKTDTIQGEPGAERRNTARVQASPLASGSLWAARLALCAVLLLAGCGSTPPAKEDGGPPADAGAGDAGAPDGGSGDGGGTPDGGSDGGGADDGGMSVPCGTESCGPGQYCRYADCSFDPATATCAARPTSCPIAEAPKCACDGTTYKNACEAAKAGATVLYDGACGEAGAPCGGIAGLGCNDGLYCQLADCTQPDAEGTCSVHPAICPTQPEWVCGCDGQNYLNACQAAAAGVSVLHTGKCGETGAPCGGLAGLVCADGYYCNYATGCGAGDVTGTCQKKPQACPPNYDPVCGCDGKTYGNGCEAAAAGVSLRDTGPCN